MKHQEEKEKRIDLWELWRIVSKRKWVILVFAVAVIFMIGLRTFTATPIYRAQATLLIEEEASKILSIENEFGYQRQLNDLLRRLK